MLLPWLIEKKTTIFTGVRYHEINAKGLVVIDQTGRKQMLEADNIIVATPPEPNTGLFEALKGKVPEIYMIGNCKGPGLIINAIADGYNIGNSI